MSEASVQAIQQAIAYARVSTEEQVQQGVSLAAQEDRLRAYCASASLQLVEVIREEGVSGSIPLFKRPAGSRLAGFKRNGVRNVVAVKLDRLFRNAADALVQTEQWDRTGIALHLVDMGGQALNTASAMGRFFLSMTASFAELERNMISERTAMALHHKRDHREVYGGIPLGFKRVEDRLEEDAKEMVVVRRIIKERGLGRSLREIAGDLNREMVPTKSGGKWYASTVLYVVKNNLYSSIPAAI